MPAAADATVDAACFALFIMRYAAQLTLFGRRARFAVFCCYSVAARYADGRYFMRFTWARGYAMLLWLPSRLPRCASPCRALARALWRYHTRAMPADNV